MMTVEEDTTMNDREALDWIWSIGKAFYGTEGEAQEFKRLWLRDIWENTLYKDRPE